MATAVNKNIAGILKNSGDKTVNLPDTRSGAPQAIWKVTCLAWLIEKLVSWRIWTPYRMLPTVPVFTILDRVPPAIQTLLFAVSLLLILILLLKNNRSLIIALLATEVLQCMLDQNRVQPWEYQYFFIALLCICYWSNPRLFVASLAFLLASVYFYSGVNKFNPGFIQSVWNNIILRQVFHLPAALRHQAWLLASGYLVALAESALGIGLLFLRTRRGSAILLIVMHLVILAVFGPMGLRGYQILWFWNASLIALLYLVFLRTGLDLISDLSRAWKRPVIMFWGLLPAFSFVGLWPRSLSSNMFSGNGPAMVICIQDFGHHTQLKRFSTAYDPSCTCRGAPVIYLQTWIFQEARVSVNPEKRLMEEMQQRLVRQYPDCKFTFFVHP